MFVSTTFSVLGDIPTVSSEDCDGTTIATMFSFLLNQLETINGMDDLLRKHFLKHKICQQNLITVCSRCCKFSRMTSFKTSVVQLTTHFV
jgi:hypothetical protein